MEQIKNILPKLSLKELNTLAEEISLTIKTQEVNHLINVFMIINY